MNTTMFSFFYLVILPRKNSFFQVLNKCHLAKIVKQDQRLLDAPGNASFTPKFLSTQYVFPCYIYPTSKEVCNGIYENGLKYSIRYV